MSPRHDKKKREAIDRVAEMLGSRLRPEQAESAQEFARAYYARVGPEDLLAIPTDDLYGAVLSHWNLAQHRKPGEPLIRVSNPTFDEYGWQSTHTVVEIVTDDMPFLVDSVSMELNRLELTVHLIIHPVIHVRRDREGRLLGIVAPDVEGADIEAEAVMRFDVDRQSEQIVLDAMEREVLRVMGDVTKTVQDWQPMRDRMSEIVDTLSHLTLPVPEEEASEAIDFLGWVMDNHFTFIGSRTYDLREEDGQDVMRIVPGSGLGILREDPDAAFSEGFAHIPPRLRKLARQKSLLIINKSTARATVHRRAHLDYIGIRRFDEFGEVIGEWRFLGLYSSLAYSTRPSDIPVLRRKVAKVLETAGFAPNSHAGKALQNIIDNFPRDEMFQSTPQELARIVTGIVELQERHRLRLFTRRDIFDRFITALVYAPRDRYNTELRLKMQNILVDAFNGRHSEFNVQFSESVLARVHFVIRTDPEHIPEYHEADLEARMIEAMQSWTDRFQAALLERFGEARGNELVDQFLNAFPVPYRHDFSERAAVSDVARLLQIDREHPLVTYLYRPLEGPEELLRFKVYGRRRHMALSDVMPMLERMGLRVLEARPYAVEPANGIPYWILDFDMRPSAVSEMDVLEVKDKFQDAFVRVCSGETENDGFNRLVLQAGLGWRDVVLLRAICKYLLQTRVPFSQTYMEDCLARNAGIAATLVEFFHARFDPENPHKGAKRAAHLVQQIEAALDDVANLDEDRILRFFLAAVEAMLRCNFFQVSPGGGPKSYLSFKLDPTKVPELPLPLPMFEIFVYSPRVEGVHLRGGPVARGGLRWSDRREDFRTEILGLMKAQTVKNAVIVPVGAKGGFVAKQLPSADSRDAVQEEVVACYESFISGLLDITDNLVSGEVRTPDSVVRYDGDDPYLVVAADKGTASFSDIANGIAADYGFWLGDAFASGGTNGYDHKKMGITARGAWESVKRHFGELGIDTQTTPFTVVGIGDMSGDVFGNGMLLSRHIRLVAAFNHLHIFIDPNPDPETSFRERERLFALPRSTWADYDPKCISPGGGIFPRSAKSVSLSDEARLALGMDGGKLTPNEVIRAILRAPVDLLWNGGIGTYVKATGETNVEVGDRASDNVRVDGADLRCKVIGEGGNLGLTQDGRIEFARRGGLVNTDAIDNSAGVDCSDHEVNIKILLDQVVKNGDMTEKQRNRLLSSMTDDVARLVLRDNYLQTQSLSITNAATVTLLPDHVRLIRSLEHEGRLSRHLERLPDDEELSGRETAGEGLVRPELAVLLAHSKIKLYDELLESDIADDPYFAEELRGYFPQALRERFEDITASHPLRREIVVTSITNGMINRMGSVFPMRRHEATGDCAADIARAYTAACGVFDMEATWRAIESLDNKVASRVQIQMLGETRRLIDRATLWLLYNRQPTLDVSETVAQLRPGADLVAERLPKLLHRSAQQELASATRDLEEAGVPADLAQRMAGNQALYTALDIADVASSNDLKLVEVAEVYYGLVASLDLIWLLDQIQALPRATHWQQRARAALREDLFADLRSLTARLLFLTADQVSTEARLHAWLDGNRISVAHCQRVFADLKSAGATDLSMLSVAVREVGNLARTQWGRPSELVA